MQNHTERPYYRPTWETGKHGLKCPDCGHVAEGTPKQALRKAQQHTATERAKETQS